MIVGSLTLHETAGAKFRYSYVGSTHWFNLEGDVLGTKVSLFLAGDPTVRLKTLQDLQASFMEAVYEAMKQLEEEKSVRSDETTEDRQGLEA